MNCMQPLEETIPEVIHNALLSPIQSHIALDIINSNRGIIPIWVCPENQQFKLVWLDVGSYHFTEWKFRYSIQNIIEQQSVPHTFTTDIELLTHTNALNGYNALYPKGFIFQMSLCGSTLLARALAQSPHHLIMTEPSPLHENLWQYVTDNWQSSATITSANRQLIKNLILAIGRQRATEQQTYFVKFRSWNVILFDVITQLFPDVPCLFLYRDPREVLVSALNKEPVGYTRFKGTAAAAFMTGYAVAETAAMSRLIYCKSLYQSYLSAVLNSSYKNVIYLNYNQLTKQNFAKIMQLGFNHTPDEKQFTLMQVQFDYYSKNDKNTTQFVADSAKKQKAITPEIQEVVRPKLIGLYQQLEQSDNNFVKLL